MSAGPFYSYTAKEAADYILKFAATLRWSGNFPAADGIERAVNALLGPNDEQSACMDVLERLVAEAEHSMKSGEAFSRPNLLKSAKDVLAKVKP